MFSGVKGQIRSIYSSKYSLTLFELLKTYATIIMTKDFQRINIPKLPVFTTEEGINQIRSFFGKLDDWKNIDELVQEFYQIKILIKLVKQEYLLDL